MTSDDSNAYWQTRLNNLPNLPPERQVPEAVVLLIERTAAIQNAATLTTAQAIMRPIETRLDALERGLAAYHTMVHEFAQAATAASVGFEAVDRHGTLWSQSRIEAIEKVLVPDEGPSIIDRLQALEEGQHTTRRRVIWAVVIVNILLFLITEAAIIYGMLGWLASQLVEVAPVMVRL